MNDHARRNRGQHLKEQMVDVPPGTDHMRGVDEKQIVTQFDKNWIETAGLLKIDYLGLETLAVIDETLHLIRRRHNIDIDLEKVPMNDPRVEMA